MKDVDLATTEEAGATGDLGHTMLRVNFVDRGGNEVAYFMTYALVMDAVLEGNHPLTGDLSASRYEDVFGKDGDYRSSNFTLQRLKLSDEDKAALFEYIRNKRKNTPHYTFVTNCSTLWGDWFEDKKLIDDAPLTPKGLRDKVRDAGLVESEFEWDPRGKLQGDPASMTNRPKSNPR